MTFCFAADNSFYRFLALQRWQERFLAQRFKDLVAGGDRAHGNRIILYIIRCNIPWERRSSGLVIMCVMYWWKINIRMKCNKLLQAEASDESVTSRGGDMNFMKKLLKAGSCKVLLL